MKIRANGIDIEVEDSGVGAPGEQRPAVLLIMGLGMQLTEWPAPLVQALLGASLRVIRMDNRDIGLSQHFDQLGTPNLLWQSIKLKLGLTLRAPYSLTDMARDAIGVLDALGVEKAHVVGVSMGGMIAQRVAIAAPERVLSLTSIMSSSGAQGLPQARPEVMRALMGRPASSALGDLLDHYVRLFKAIGSPGFPMTEAQMRERITAGIQRSFHPAGTQRQMLAVVADAGRAAELARVESPTLVLHGKADPLVPYACGEDTARRIRGAKLVGVEGMGHDLPPGVIERLLEPMLAHLRAA